MEEFKKPIMLVDTIGGRLHKLYDAIKDLESLPVWRIVKRERALCEIRQQTKCLFELLPEIDDKIIGNILFSYL